MRMGSSNAMVGPCSCPTGDAGMGRVSMKHRHVQQVNHDHCHQGTDIGKNSFHVVGRDRAAAGAVMPAAMAPRLIGMEACVDEHRLATIATDARSICARVSGSAGSILVISSVSGVPVVYRPRNDRLSGPL